MGFSRYTPLTDIANVISKAEEDGKVINIVAIGKLRTITSENLMKLNY